MTRFLLASLLLSACATEPLPVTAALSQPGEPCTVDADCAKPEQVEGALQGAYCNHWSAVPGGPFCAQWITLPCYADQRLSCIDFGGGPVCGTCGVNQ
jgi:hypothetical protein